MDPVKYGGFNVVCDGVRGWGGSAGGYGRIGRDGVACRAARVYRACVYYCRVFSSWPSSRIPAGSETRIPTIFGTIHNNECNRNETRKSINAAIYHFVETLFEFPAELF